MFLPSWNQMIADLHGTEEGISYSPLSLYPCLQWLSSKLVELKAGWPDRARSIAHLVLISKVYVWETPLCI